MDAASADAGFDFDDLGFLDGLECFDLDLPADFFLAGPAGKDGGLGLGLDLGSPDHDDGGREGSPDSVVTDDGATPSSGDGGGEMSDYVSDLERFLMEDDDDYDLGADEYHFPGGYFGAEPVVGPGVDEAKAMRAEEELTADNYFLDDYCYVADDGYTDPAAGAGIDDTMLAGAKDEEIAADEYFFDDFYVTDGNGYAEPAASASVVDPASPILEEEEYFAAREDEATSRKRASIHDLRQRRCAAKQSSC